MILTDLRTATRRKISLVATATDFPDATVDAFLNEAYREVLGWILTAMGIWEYRGEMSYTTLIKDQNEYPLPPSDFISINRVEVRYYGNTEYVKAYRIDDKQKYADTAALQNGDIPGSTKAAPWYRLFDDSLFLYPREDTADSPAGLFIEYSRDVVDLASGTDKPVIPTVVQRVLAEVASLYIMDAEDMKDKYRRKLRYIYGDYEEDPRCLKQQVVETIRQRDRSVKTSVRPRPQSFR